MVFVSHDPSGARHRAQPDAVIEELDELHAQPRDLIPSAALTLALGQFGVTYFSRMDALQTRVVCDLANLVTNGAAMVLGASVACWRPAALRSFFMFYTSCTQG